MPIPAIVVGALISGALGAGGSLLSSGANHASAKDLTEDEFRYNLALQDDAQEFNANEAQKQRDFSLSEAQKVRDFNSDEAQKVRDFNSEEAKLARDWQTSANQIQMDFNHKEAELARAFDRDMSSTAIQRQVADMRKAGINPILAAQYLGSSTPSAPSASVGGSSASSASGFGASASSLSGSSASSNSVGVRSSNGTFRDNIVGSILDTMNTARSIERLAKDYVKKDFEESLKTDGRFDVSKILSNRNNMSKEQFEYYFNKSGKVR